MEIKNIVFDIGNVLMRWDPPEIYKTLFGKDDFSDHPLSMIVGGDIWLDMDKGLLSLAEGIAKAAEGYEFYKDEIETFFRKAPYHFYPIQETMEFVKMCKESGYRLFLLSNFHEYGYRILRERFSVFNKFEGGVISWEVKINKPDLGIYRTLLLKYGLNPSETFFIDDTIENIEAAESLGINGLHFKRGVNLPIKLQTIISNFSTLETL